MIRLDTADAGFAGAFDALVDARRETPVDVARDVSAIIRSVRDEGDAAVRAFTQKLDRHDPDETGWRVDAAACAAAFDALEPELRIALELAAARIHAYHLKQRPEDSAFTDAAGVRLGARWRPVDAAGIYVPGGRAAYPSTLLMNAIPARVAGVERLVVVTPTPGGEINPLVLAAALALQVVRVHHAFGDLLVLAEGAALAQRLVDQRGLAVVDVGDDGDVADLSGHGAVLWVSGTGRRGTPSRSPASIGLSRRVEISSPPRTWPPPRKALGSGP